ncbi:MAG: pyridoxal phosphate-dependent aminotransferase [Clostridiales bacterium]|nr:pyridoxal phosphate-dependent aminotransferase [Clostridiales bacterium]
MPNKYNFDVYTDRTGTHSAQHDDAPADGLPLWVADTDFPTVKEANEAIIKAAEKGIYGYERLGDEYYKAIINWFDRHHGLKIKKDWVVNTPGVVTAVGLAINAYTEKGESVMINRPVYYPFSNTINASDRKLINSPMVYKNGEYTLDFADFEEKIKNNNVKLYILCSPHNPISKVWKKDELKKIGDICHKYGVKVISDEIHADLALFGNKHTPFASLGKKYADISITCTSPSKTFNLAGLQMSNIVISNPQMREKFKKAYTGAGLMWPTFFSAFAIEAAYNNGDEYLAQLKEYIEGNFKLAEEFFKEKLPKVKIVKPEGTYLGWFDFSEYGLTGDEMEHLLQNKAKLFLDGGNWFGPEGDQFQRVNMAYPRSTIQTALEKLEMALTPTNDINAKLDFGDALDLTDKDEKIALAHYKLRIADSNIPESEARAIVSDLLVAGDYKFVLNVLSNPKTSSNLKEIIVEETAKHIPQVEDYFLNSKLVNAQLYKEYKEFLKGFNAINGTEYSIPKEIQWKNMPSKADEQIMLGEYVSDTKVGTNKSLKRILDAFDEGTKDRTRLQKAIDRNPQTNLGATHKNTAMGHKR